MNPFHLVQASPWPLAASLGGFYLLLGIALWFNGKGLTLLTTGLLVLTLVCFLWWRDVIRESTFMGFHTSKVQSGIRLGFIMFIVSELMFFFAFFWAFFHASLAPSVELGQIWPPVGINPIDPWGVPLLNTVILLSSGVSVTMTHHYVLTGDLYLSLQGLVITVGLGIFFTMLQAGEYFESSFSITDSVYGSTFFVATGFHGLHVIVGTIFLAVNLMRLWNLHFTRSHHVGLEAAVWYWHFVDVIWLFLFVAIYWWGS